MNSLTYVSLEDLETIAFQYAHQGVQVIAAQGPSGDEWQLRVRIGTVETVFRAHRVGAVA